MARAQQMIDAITAAQRADLLQLDLSPRCGREAAGADTRQVASHRTRSPDPGALAEGDVARGVFVGVAAQGMGSVGPEAQSDALRRPESGSAAAVARKEIGPGHAGQGWADLFAGRDGQSRGHRQGSGSGRWPRRWPSLPANKSRSEEHTS